MSTDTPEAPDVTSPEPDTAPEAAPQIESSPSLASGLNIGSEAAETAEEGEVPQYEPMIRGKIDRFGVAWGTGRRKTSVARVRIKDGKGSFKVNGRDVDDYFPVERDRAKVRAPLKVTEMLGKVDIEVSVNGGGLTGQTGAVVLGIARALQAKNPQLHHTLSDGDFLTRDSRMVERKKYGKKGARRSFQFSKR